MVTAKRGDPTRQAADGASPKVEVAVPSHGTTPKRPDPTTDLATPSQTLGLQQSVGNSVVARMITNRQLVQREAGPTGATGGGGDGWGEGQRLGGEGGGEDLDPATIRQQRLAAIEQRRLAALVPAPVPVAPMADEPQIPDRRTDPRRLQQLAALRQRGLLNFGHTGYAPYQSGFDEHLDARDEAAQSRTNALVAYAPIGRLKRDLAALDTALVAARTADGAAIGAVEGPARALLSQAERTLAPGDTGLAVTAVGTLSTEVARINQQHSTSLAALDTAVADSAKKALRKRAADEATFDAVEIGAMTATVRQEVAQAKQAGASTLTVTNAQAAVDAFDVRVADDITFLGLIAKIPGGMAALDDASAFEGFRSALKQTAVSAWTGFKQKAAVQARVIAACQTDLEAVAAFFVTKEDLAKKVKGKADHVKVRSVDQLLDTGPVKAYQPQGNDLYMLGQLLEATPDQDAEGVDAAALKKLLGIANVDAASLVSWMKPVPAAGPEDPTPSQTMEMLVWAADGTAFGSLRECFKGKHMTQLRVLLERCKKGGPDLKYLAVDRAKTFGWLDDLTQEHSLTKLADFVKANTGQRFWRPGDTCGAPAPGPPKNLDQIVTDAVPLTRSNRNNLIAAGSYVGNRSFGNRGTIDDVQSDGSVTTTRCMALPTRRNNINISYTEYDLAVLTNANRGPLRFVVGSDGSRYYTADHYLTFKRFKAPT